MENRHETEYVLRTLKEVTEKLDRLNQRLFEDDGSIAQRLLLLEEDKRRRDVVLGDQSVNKNRLLYTIVAGVLLSGISFLGSAVWFGLHTK